jgi:hypothetical protein
MKKTRNSILLGLEEEDDPYAYYMAQSAFVEATISDDDHDFEFRYLSYADGCNTIQDLYNRCAGPSSHKATFNILIGSQTVLTFFMGIRHHR